MSTCAPIVGCNVKDQATTTFASSECEPKTSILGQRRNVAEPTPAIQRRGECDFIMFQDAIIYPRNPKDVGQIIAYLQNTKYKPPNSGVELSLWSMTKPLQAAGFTALFIVELIENKYIDFLNNDPTMQQHVRYLVKHSEFTSLTLSVLSSRLNKVTAYTLGTGKNSLRQVGLSLQLTGGIVA
jgi:hypothetical protein